MMARLWAFQVKKQLPWLLMWCLAALLLCAGAVSIYDDYTVEQLSNARAQGTFLFSAMGILGSATLSNHLASLLYGLLLPVLGSALAICLSARMTAGKLETGEMAYYLALPLRRSTVALVQAAVVGAGLLLFVLSAVAGGVAAAAWLKPGELSIVWFFWMNAGLFLMLCMSAGLALAVSLGSDEAARARRLAGLLFLVLFVVYAISRPGQMPAWLRYFSWYSLYDPQALSTGRLSPAYLLMLPVSLLLLLIGLRRFASRNLPL